MTFIFALLVIGVVAVIALVATGRFGKTSDAVRDRPPVELPTAPVTADDLRNARFSIAFRGYRMDEVDALLAQVTQTLEPADGTDPAESAAQAGTSPPDTESVVVDQVVSAEAARDSTP